MNRALIVLFPLALAGAALAQGSEAPKTPEKATQDPAAVKMLERFDVLRYIPRAEGLKDLQFTIRLPQGLDFVLRWKAPAKFGSELVVPADAPRERARQLAITAEQKQAEARKNAEPIVTTQIGEVLHENVKDDDITLAAPNQVKIVARSAASQAKFKEQVLTFDDRGLVKHARVTAPTGMETISEPTFVEWNGKQVYQTIKTTIGKDESVVTFEYDNTGAFLLIKKATTTVKSAGKDRVNALEFKDLKANSGLDDALFEEKPAAPK